MDKSILSKLELLWHTESGGTHSDTDDFSTRAERERTKQIFKDYRISFCYYIKRVTGPRNRTYSRKYQTWYRRGESWLTGADRVSFYYDTANKESNHYS